MYVCAKIHLYSNPRRAREAAVALNRDKGFALRSTHFCTQHHAWHFSRRKASGKGKFALAIPTLNR